jgi:hypothetical protein
VNQSDARNPNDFLDRKWKILLIRTVFEATPTGVDGSGVANPGRRDLLSSG